MFPGFFYDVSGQRTLAIPTGSSHVVSLANAYFQSLTDLSVYRTTGRDCRDNIATRVA